MIASGPGGLPPPLRSAGEAQPSPNIARAAPGPISGLAGEARPASRAETSRAVDPARQASATLALPRDETNDRARLARALVEPARPAASMLAGEAPTEATPAGPPPTFDVSILEKARAVASAAPPVIQPLPEGGSGDATVAALPDTATPRPAAREEGETDFEAGRERPDPRIEAGRPASPDRPERPEPPARETAEAQTPVPPRRDPEQTRP